jgi:LysR family transcriptional regulator for bpeEF and oprC
MKMATALRQMAQAELADGRLQEVLAAWCPAPMPVSLLYPHSRQLSPRVRVFVDWVIDRMATQKVPGRGPG